MQKSEAPIAQCQANIAALLDHYELSPVSVLTSQCDRITAHVPSSFVTMLESQARLGFFRVWNMVSNHGTTAVRGWRENVHRCSMQIIEHKTGVYEFDVDLFNPDYGALPAIVHLFAEVWHRGKTNPYKVREGLKKRGIEVPFING